MSTDVARSIHAIAADIQKYHERVTASAKKTMEDARQAGEALHEAKEQVSHGEWGLWLERNVPTLSERTAQRYMKIAAGWDQIEAKTDTVSDLTIAGGIKLLSKPKADKPAEPEPEPAADEPADETGSEEPSADDHHDLDPSHDHDVDPQPRPSTTVHRPEPQQDPDSMDAACEGLDEVKADARALATKARKVFRVDGQNINAPWLGRFSWSGAIGSLNQYVRMLDDLRPVGGTPDKPVTARDEKAKGALRDD